MNIPRVSFVLPAYKREFLHEAIRSILAQTYQDFELIIVNDASPQDLDSVIKEFSDTRLKYYVNKKNLGGYNLTDSWNHALKYATGEYIVLASDDDIYHSRYLEKIIELVIKYPSVDLFRTRLRYINERGEFQHSAQPCLEFESCEYFIYQRLLYSRKQAAPGFLFRKSAMDRIGGFVRFPLAWYADDATWTALSVNGVCCTQEALVDFRMSGINLSTASIGNEQKIEALYQYRQWLNVFLQKRDPQNAEDKKLLNICQSMYESILNSHIFLYLPYVPMRNYCKILQTAVKNHFFSHKTALAQLFRRIIFQ